MKTEPYIIIIEDDVKFEDDPFVIELRDLYQNVDIIPNSINALKFIEENIDRKMVVFLDLGLTPNMPDGHEVLKRIRDISYLVPVIIWSGRDEDKETFSDLIEHRAFAFMSKSASSEELIEVLNKAIDSSNNNIGCVIEEWIKAHPEENKDKKFLQSSDGVEYTLNQILTEIRLQTPFGVEVGNNIHYLTIDLLMRKKETLS